MRVALCVTPAFHAEAPPLGLAYLKASLQAEGHSVRCFDFSGGHDHLCYPVGPSDRVVETFQETGPIVDGWVDRIERMAPDLVGITLWFSNGLTARMLARAVKERLPGTIVVGGGPDFLEGNKADYLACFDYGVENEGERALCELVREIERTGEASTTPGVWRKVDGAVVSAGSRERIQDLDSLPYPDFSDFDVASYPEGIPVMFSRGCSANCTFCTNKKFFRNQTSRTAAGMYDEIRTQVDRTGLRRFIFADDSLLSPSNLEEFLAFCKRVTRGRLDIRWRVYAQRILPALRKRHVKQMRKAGLESIGFGVESLSERLRRDMGKAGTDADTERVLFDFVDAGVRTNILMLYGYPIETEEDFAKTLRWLERKGSRFAHICFSCFVVNSVYCRRRPGVVTFETEGRHPYRWWSKEVDLARKKERFLRLMEVLDGLGVPYMVADPFVSTFYRTWDHETRAAFEEEWCRRAAAP